MKHLIFFTALLFSFSVLVAQEKKEKEPLSKVQRLNSYLQEAEKFSELYPQEKVYLHFDNTSYYLNEHIWFKAYVTRAEDHSLSSLSKTLYVELLNKDGFLVERKMYPVVNGQAKGDFLVSDSCEAGFYEVRAYTRWMRNWDDACVFSRVFPVFNEPEINNMWHQTMLQRKLVSPTDRRIDKEKENRKFQLLFFPEGGELVEGISSQVAFKAIDKEGASALNVIGKIYSKKDKRTILDINTQHNGMGTFTFTPLAGEKYFARIIHEKESYEFDLPRALTQGYTLQVNNYPTARLIVTIQKSNRLQADTLGFTVSCRGQVLASQLVFTTDSTGAQFSISKEKLPEGIMQLTLFDYKGKILCERMVFIHPQKPGNEIGIKLEEESIDLSSAALNEIGFRLTDPEGRPLARTGVSVSVRDGKTELSNWSNESARVNLLLSSDLKGHIEHPDYYFEKLDNTRIQHLDLLMLVQGWRRYEWQQMSGVIPFTPQFKAEKGITIDGRVTHLMNKKKPYPNVQLSYMLFGGTGKTGFDFDGLVTDKGGEFSTTLQFFGIRPIVIQTRNSKSKRRETYIQLFRNFRPSPRILNPAETTQEFTLRKFIEESNKELFDPIELLEEEEQLKEITVEARRHRIRRYLPPEDIRIDVDRAIDEIRDDGIEPSSVVQVLERYDPYFDCITGYYIEGTRHLGRKLNILYGGNRVWQETAVARSENHTLVSPIGMREIFIPSEPQADGSYVAIITLHKNAHKKVESYGIRKSRIQGYNLVSSFYSPQYIMGNPEAYDGRRTLMWLPDLVTDEQGRGTIEFYNSPTCREFIFDIQCVNRDGKIGSYYGIFNQGNTHK